MAQEEGDTIGVDDLLAEVETDKATMEYRSFDKGTLLKILVPAGSVVKLGQPVAIMGNAGEDVSALAAQHGGEQPSAPAPAPHPAGRRAEGGSGACRRAASAGREAGGPAAAGRRACRRARSGPGEAGAGARRSRSAPPRTSASSPASATSIRAPQQRPQRPHRRA